MISDLNQLRAYIEGYGDGIDFVLDRANGLMPEPEADPGRDGSGAAGPLPHQSGKTVEVGAPAAPLAGGSDPSTDNGSVSEADRAQAVQAGMVMGLRAMAEEFRAEGLLGSAAACDAKADALASSAFRELV